jgi:hypothetical protein
MVVEGLLVLMFGCGVEILEEGQFCAVEYFDL